MFFKSFFTLKNCIIIGIIVIFLIAIIYKYYSFKSEIKELQRSNEEISLLLDNEKANNTALQESIKLYIIKESIQNTKNQNELNDLKRIKQSPKIIYKEKIKLKDCEYSLEKTDNNDTNSIIGVIKEIGK
jgi:hypothetical protein|nr:MAG TPA: cell division protein [Caudoviricetes sp.]